MIESRIEKLTRIGQEMAAAVAEMNAEAVDLTPDLTTELANRQIEGEAAWWRSVDFDRNASRTFESMTGDSQQAVRTGVERVLAYLQSTGRLVPAGGMALTAEQVEDVRIVTTEVGGYAAEQFRRWHAAKDRLVESFFSATEPAAVRDGSDLVVVQRSHTAKAVQSWMTLDLWTDLGKNDKDFDAEYERQGFGDLWATLLGEVRALVQATTPAPAEPAEEETKAEEPVGTVCDETQKAYDEAVSLSYWLAKQLGEHVDDAYDRGETLTDTVQRLIEHIRPNLGKTKTAASPVVPAPTETGPWPTWESVPDDVWFTSASAVGFLPAHRKRGSLVDWQFRDGSVGVYDVSRIGNGKLMARAPFVAAEEG
ncbi:hypothetical protein J6K27_003513 [Rhodococcus qingshengii]|uniref:hypothetical protein n=1 Tax=Rhodococcus qingshengii TaxID=334542 RepID=UPI001AEFE2A4|nr:hypothetical protein [Rhodococcus qingshengii]QTR98385.1 hypothetical protein J6K27_003513 [Rhodococcus qingshengii]